MTCSRASITKENKKISKYGKKIIKLKTENKAMMLQHRSHHKWSTIMIMIVNNINMPFFGICKIPLHSLTIDSFTKRYM